MKALLTCLLLFGVLAGGWSRAFAADSCETHMGATSQQHSHHEQHHGHQHPCGPVDDEGCPFDHHHHGCCHVMPLVADAESQVAWRGLGFSRVGLHLEDASAPEAPVDELDKPPLI